MSRQVKELRALLAPRQTTRGKVLAVDGTTARVATDTATAIVRVPPNLIVKQGDAVKIQDGLVIGTLRDRAGVPVYDI